MAKESESGRSYPPVFERLVPIVVGVILVAMILLLVIAAGVALGLFPGAA